MGSQARGFVATLLLLPLQRPRGSGWLLMDGSLLGFAEGLLGRCVANARGVRLNCFR